MNKEILLSVIISTLAISGVYLGVGNKVQFLDNYQSQFDNFKNKYNLLFSNSNEEAYRLSVFLDNLKYINEINQDQSNFKLGINQFAHLTSQEFEELYLQNKKPEDSEQTHNSPQNFVIVPKQLDWRKQGAVTPVRNMGECDASYAFSTIGVAEAYYNLVGQLPLTEFSAQQIVSCNDFGAGCQGSSVAKTMEYIINNGVYEELDYPYTAQTGYITKCDKDVSKVPDFNAPVYYTWKPAKSVQDNYLAQALVDGPVSSGIDGHNLQLYHGGIFDKCGQNRNIDMLIIGFTEDYWIVKTPFSTSWGENGYLRLARGNTCGVCTEFYSLTSKQPTK